jgi:uncharacterized protein (TIGR02118 family)
MFVPQVAKGNAMVARRSVIATSLAGAAALLEGCATSASQTSASSSGKVKLTVLHHTPKDSAAFDQYYKQTHLPLSAAVKDLPAAERSKPMPLRPGAPMPYYQMVEFRFDSPEHFRSVMSSPEWAKVRDDVKDFATNGVTVVVSRIL